MLVAALLDVKLFLLQSEFLFQVFFTVIRNNQDVNLLLVVLIKISILSGFLFLLYQFKIRTLQQKIHDLETSFRSFGVREIDLNEITLKETDEIINFEQLVDGYFRNKKVQVTLVGLDITKFESMFIRKLALSNKVLKVMKVLEKVVKLNKCTKIVRADKIFKYHFQCITGIQFHTHYSNYRKNNAATQCYKNKSDDVDKMIINHNLYLSHHLKTYKFACVVILEPFQSHDIPEFTSISNRAYSEFGKLFKGKFQINK